METKNNIIKYFETNFEKFSKSEKRISNFISSNLDEVPFFNTKILAEKSNCSSSTVVRFAKKAGYRGYPEMQAELQKILLNKINTSGPYERAKQLKQQLKTNELFNSLRKDLNNLNELIQKISYKDLKVFVDRILKANSRYVVANLSSFSLGHFFSLNAGKIISPIQFLTDYDGGIFNHIKEIHHGDIVIIFCFPRYTELTIKFAQLAAQKGADILSISDSKISPIFKISKICLLCPSDGYFLVNSNVAATALINCIISELYNRDKNGALKNLEEAEHIYSQVHTVRYIK